MAFKSPQQRAAFFEKNKPGNVKPAVQQSPGIPMARPQTPMTMPPQMPVGLPHMPIQQPMMQQHFAPRSPTMAPPMQQNNFPKLKKLIKPGGF